MTQPGEAGYSTEDVRALPVCKVGTLLTHDWMDVKSNLSVAELASAWQYAGTGDGRRRW